MPNFSFTGIRKIPFVRILIPFILGDLTGLYANRPWLWAGVTFIVGLFLVLWGYTPHKPAVRYQREWVGGSGILFLFFLLGFIASAMNGLILQKKASFEGDSVVAGYIYQPAVLKDNSVRVEMITRGIRKNKTWYNTHGKVVLYFRKKSRIVSAKPGEAILFHGRLEPFSFYGNPGEFNYRRYQYDRGVFWRVFVSEKAWRYVQDKPAFSPVLIAKKIQYMLVSRLKAYGLTRGDLAVASALTAGDREFLDPGTKKYFADSGTMHILAISGLHVGIIYLVSMYLFSFFGKRRYMLMLRLVMVLGLLWSYAFITGLSPSVMRATLMFSLLLLGQSFRRKADIFNILAVSAFILLVIRPALIRDPGFQLSYFAVLGIVIFYKPLYLVAARGFWWTDKIWSLLVVTVAALIGTFPLTLYYFHRFPVYAPFTNLLVIPIVTLFIYTGLVFFLLQPFPWAAGLLAQIMKGLSGGLFFITKKSLMMPSAVISPVWLHKGEVLLLYLIVLAIILIATTRKPVSVIFFQVVLLSGVILMLIRETEGYRKRLAVLNIPGSSVCIFSSGKTGVIRGDTDKKNTTWYLKNSKGALGLEKLVLSEGTDRDNTDLKGIYFYKGFFKMGSVTGFFLKDTVCVCRKETEVNYLIFSGRKWWLLEKQLLSVRPRRIVLDASVPAHAIKKIRQMYPDRFVYSVHEQGPFYLEESRRKGRD